MSETELRAFSCVVEARTGEKEGRSLVVEGMPIVFGQQADIGSFYEIISRDALEKTDMKDVPLFVNHDTSQVPLARSRNNNQNSTMQLSVREDGVHILAALDEKNQRAQELWSAVKRGDISGMSFMFRVDGDEWKELESGKPTRTIKSISRIYEVSAVTYPAYTGTSISARSLESDDAALDSAKRTLESARKRKREIDDLNKRLRKGEAE